MIKDSKPCAKPTEEENHRRTVRQDKILNRYLLSIDPSYEYVIFRASNANIYRFEDEWSEMGIEGSLYIYRRNKDEGHRLIVFNRKGLNDFKLNISSHFYLEFENQFVIFSYLDKKNIFGFWFDNSQESKKFFKALESLKIDEETAIGF